MAAHSVRCAEAGVNSLESTYHLVFDGACIVTGD